MKKTIIASAIAAVVAAPAAFADVTISGNVNMEILDQDASTGWDNSTNTDLVFAASEDLGNGMKAGMKYHMFHDDGSDSVADTSVFVSGDFGTVTAGRMETFNMAYFHGFAAGDAAHDMTLEDTNGQQGRGNAVAYVSPSMNGLTVGLAAVIDAGAVNTVATGTAATDTDDVDMQEIMVKYSNAGLTVAAGKTTHKGGSSSDEEITNIAVSYTIGDLKLAVLDRNVDNSDGSASTSTAPEGDNDMTTVSATYKMGNNTFYAGVTDSDDTQDGDWVVSAAHNLSKRTSVYIALKNDDSDDNTDTLIGMKHSF
jgi:predicted porin